MVLYHHYIKKNKKLNQRKIYYKGKNKIVQQQKDKFMHFKEIVRTCVEKDNRLKALKEKAVNK